MSAPWSVGLDLRVLRHVRGVLRRRGLELVLVEERPAHAAAYAPLDGSDGAGLAVIAPELGAAEGALIESMLGEAANDVAAALRERREGAARSPWGTEPPGRRTSYHGIIGGAPIMQELYVLLGRVSPSDSTVLIQGENGTGKELVARAIHEGSDRRDRKFVVTNCSAFNDNLLDSELFGHKRGAFTGAVADKQGLFEIADAGTFFLDEIGDMSPALQVKVLRVLQEGTFNRVGDTETRMVDVRIIAATNRDLSAMVAAGQFREDLFYRIHVINVTVPALRERREDIPLLIEHFLARHRRTRTKRLAPACSARMLVYPWPGNVRELENEIERLVVLSGDEPMIGAELLSPRIRQWEPSDGDAVDAGPDSLPAAVEALERRMIGAAMRRHRGNKTRAAEELKVSRRNLIRLVQKYELE
ncbi:MAG TPA: sigma 54-interacting transcriptional regulator [Kofleriaceae bacterium]|jgi:transcriptional regulator with PAS, ATPase and Fis domain|nr:sigma 54-interacting transcriptional regulator [Kofleriaceae bacterium]